MRKQTFILFILAIFFSVGTLFTGCGRETKNNATPVAALIGANGYKLTPAGTQIGADRKSIPMPSEIAITPDGKTVLVLSTGWIKTGGNHRITAIDAMTDTIMSSLSLYPYESFDGITVNNTGTDIYVPGILKQQGFILDVDIDSGRNMSLKQEIPLQPYNTSTFGSPRSVMPTPAGIAVNGNLLISADDVSYDYYGNQYPGETVSIIDLSSGTQTFTVTTGGLYPWAIIIAPDGKKAYVTNRGSATVSVISLVGTPSLTTTIPVQAGPASIISSFGGSRLYVANTLSDTVSVINTSTNKVSDTISLALYSGEPAVAGLPDALALSKDGSRLYVAMAADNAIAVVDTATNEVIGRIPTAWYPAGVVFNNTNNHIFVVNMNGIGHGPWVPTSSKDTYDFSKYDWYVYGSVSDISQPSSNKLMEYTDQVMTNDFISPKHSPVPADIKAAWKNIKHIVYIYRENKTYDMEFGDLGPSANGQSVPCPFYSPGSLNALSILPVSYGCANYGVGITTPNTHAMAKQFVLDSNFYLDVETSIQGHPYAIDGMISDYLERIWAINMDYGGLNRQDDWDQPISDLPSGTIFDHLLKAGLTFSDFGQTVPRPYNSIFDSVTPPSALAPYVDTTYGSLFSDVVRANYFVSAFKNMVANDTFPNFIFMTLGDDHFPPGAYSENDYATALIVQAITHSKYWGSTAIFINEDDPQVGMDHIDQLRSFMIVVSPYAKRGYISTAHYSFAGVLKTIELIFNIPPMTEYDATALPLYDMFQAKPDMRPFAALPETWPALAKAP